MKPEAVDWDGLLAEALERGKDVPEVAWCQPGEDAGMGVSSPLRGACLFRERAVVCPPCKDVLAWR